MGKKEIFVIFSTTNILFKKLQYIVQYIDNFNLAEQSFITYLVMDLSLFPRIPIDILLSNKSSCCLGLPFSYLKCIICSILQAKYGNTYLFT